MLDATKRGACVLAAGVTVIACAPFGMTRSEGTPIDVPTGDAGTVIPGTSLNPVRYLYADPNVSSEMVLVGSTLYFVDRGASINDTVQALDLNAMTATTLFTAWPDPSAAIEDLAADASNLYVTEVTGAASGYTSRVAVIPQSGGAPGIVATTSAAVFDVVAANGVAYYRAAEGYVSVSATGGTPALLPGGGLWEGLASFQGQLYVEAPVFFTNSAINVELVRLAPDGANPQTVAMFELDAQPLFAGNSTTLVWNTGPASGAVLARAPLAGGQPTNFANVIGTVIALAADERYAFVMTYGAYGPTYTLFEYALDDGSATILANGIEPDQEVAAQHALAVDDSSVYFTTAGWIASVSK